MDELWRALLAGECGLGRLARFDCDVPVGFTASAPALPRLANDDPRATTIIATTKGQSTPGKPVHPFSQRGPWRHVSNACVSGAVSVIEGADLLVDREFDKVTALGFDAVTPFIIDGFKSLNALSDNPARPFDKRRNGLSLGEARASVTLRRSADIENPDQFARVVSYGCSNDANHISGPSKDGGGLALAIRRALAGVEKSKIRAICAHGTATAYNDAMEARAFHTVFNGSPPSVFGIKGAIGHTLGAAGLIEVLVSARVAMNGVIPPTVGFEEGEDDYPLDVVHGEARTTQPGYVLSTNSGFGGVNTGIVIGPGGAP